MRALEKLGPISQFYVKRSLYSVRWHELGATTMLLRQLLESPKTSSNLLVYDPFRELDREELVKEVVGLANADVDGPRNILFGVNGAAVGGSGVVGIPDNVAAELKKAHRLISALVEPVLDLAFIYDSVNGKLVGALEIDGCDFGPYFVGQDYSETLSRGQCWVREGWKLRAVDRADLLHSRAPQPEEKPAKSPENVVISVGFNDDPECQLLEMPVPDTSNPPFAEENRDVKKPSKLRQVIKDTVGTVTTQMLRMGQGSAKESVEPEADTSGDAGKLFAEAQAHYYYEEKAAKLNLCVCNKGSDDIEEASIEFGLPRIADFDVADHVHISPFDKRASSKSNRVGYPDVEHRDDAIFVRSSLDFLAAGSTEQAFRCPLRLAVGPGMQDRKVAIHYTLRGPDNKCLSKGRLKIKFGKISDYAA